MKVLVGPELENALIERLSIPGRKVILGVGNTLRADDGVGIYSASQLGSEDHGKGTVVILCGELPENYLS